MARTKSSYHPNSFLCPICGWRARTVITRIVTDKTRTKVYQCTNVDCSMTFDTTEEITKERVKSGLAPLNQTRMF